jgi:hypothetical protein
MSQSPPPDDWRHHEHCEFCFGKFSENPGDLREGYASADRYRWVCETCFRDFRDEMDWKLEG